MDFLGLRTLGAVHRTLDLIEKRYGIKIDTDEIDLNDPMAMKLIASGQTDGVFQVESDGMKAMFKSMSSVNFDNIVAGISLYRPGPMDFIPQYVACLNGTSKVRYLFPQLEPILKDTYGVLIYQEQLMLIAKDIAGFGWIETDGFRKAVGKKKEKLIKQMTEWLIEGHRDDEKGINIPGLLSVGVDRKLALKLGEDLISFGSYAFNKSHAAGYAKVVVITAYLKARYPIEYMTPLISSFIGKDPVKVTQYITEAKRMGLKILPPDVNASEFEFSIEDNAIRYGLGAIKGLGKTGVALCEERMKNGPFKDINDLLDRFGKRELNKKSIDVLVLSGALDSLIKVQSNTEEETEKTDDNTSVVDSEGNVDRAKLLEVVYSLRGYGDTDGVIDSYCDEEASAKMKKKYAKALTNSSEVRMKLLSAEHGLMGMYISAHPLDGKAEPIDWGMYTHTMRFDVVAIVRNVKAITTRFGKPMAFLSIETLEGMKDVTVFSKEYEANINKLEKGAILLLTLEAQLRDGTYCYLAKNIKYFKEPVRKEM